MIRMLLVDELEHAGYSVIEAENADIAIEMLQIHSEIGVVVTDGGVDDIHFHPIESRSFRVTLQATF